jgi:hypothetical protein
VQLQIYINESQGSDTPFSSSMIDNPDQLTFSAERTSWLEAENRRLHGALAFSYPKTTANYLPILLSDLSVGTACRCVASQML